MKDFVSVKRKFFAVLPTSNYNQRIIIVDARTTDDGHQASRKAHHERKPAIILSK